MKFFNFFKKESSPAVLPPNRIGAEKPGENDKGEEEIKEQIDEGRRRFLKTGGKALAGAGLAATGLPAVAEAAGRFMKKDQSEIDKIRQAIRRDAGLDEKPADPNSPDQAEKQAEPIRQKIEQREINNIADHFLNAYYELSRQDKYFPKSIFPKSLLIAQQLQESDYDKTARSKANALGVMQNMSGSIKDVAVFLNRLKRNENINYTGPPELNNKQIKEIKRWLTVDADYSRAFGKIYLMQLYNPRYGYGIGREHIEAGNTKEGQKEILASYNGGMSRIKGIDEEKWPSESRDYVKKIFYWQKNIERIMRHSKKSNINLNDKQVKEIAKKMKSVYGEPEKEEQIILASIKNL